MAAPKGSHSILWMVALCSGSACVEPELAATVGLGAVLVTQNDGANHTLRALKEGEPLVLSGGGGSHYLLEYPFDHPTLGLSPGDLPPPGPEECGARSLGDPARTSRLALEPELKLEETTLEPLADVKLPALDLATCAARRGCLEVEAGFAICKSTCTTLAAPTPPNPPAPPAPPTFCDDAACPSLGAPCPLGHVLPGETECVDLGPCGSGTFRDQAPTGPRPFWVSAAAAIGGDGSPDRPFRTLAEALERGATDLYLSEGEYQAPPTLLAATRIYGVCPSRTTVWGPISTEHDLGLVGLNLDRGPVTLTVRGATMTMVEVTLSGGALELQNAKASLHHTELVGAEVGIETDASQLTITSSHIVTSLARTNRGTIEATSSTVTLEGVRFDGPSAGAGVVATDGSTLTLRRSAFLGLLQAVRIEQGEVELSDVDVEVKGAVPGDRDVGAIGLNGARAHFRRVRIDGATNYAIVARESALQVEDLITLDSGAALPGRFDLTAVLLRRSPATFERWRSNNDVQALDTIHPDDRVEVRDLDVSGDGDRPVVAIRSESPLTMERVRIGVRRGPAVTLARGGLAEVRDLAIEGASVGLLFELDGGLSGERVAITADRGAFGTASALRVSDLRIEARSAGVELGRFVGTSTSPPQLEHFVLSVAAGPAFNFGAPPRPPLTLRSGTLSGTDPGPAARCAPTWGWRIEDLQLGP
ncbi:MAG: hypothetical protein IPG45_24635 [Deltaproteobacteria bacterium]|nr:hypothetical protein [Deltaproteobacteria bacterium]